MSFFCVFLLSYGKQGREQIQLLLHVTSLLLFDDGILFCINKNMCSRRDLMSCLWILFIHVRSSKASTLPCSLIDFLGLVTSVFGIGSGRWPDGPPQSGVAQGLI